MTGFFDAVQTLHTRGVNIGIGDYVFCLLSMLGEDKGTSFAIAYDADEMKKHFGTDEEGEYVAQKEHDANTLMQQPHIKQLIDLLQESYRAEVQSSALKLKDFKFSGQETVQILNNILKNRVNDLDTASVRDVVSLIKMLSDQGALETGDGGFGRHFIQIFPKFNALCNNCNREFQIASGIGAICPHCGQEYHWSSEENRFYPQPQKL